MATKRERRVSRSQRASIPAHGDYVGSVSIGGGHAT